MSQPEIKADKINSPIQLMAAWFVMLILLSGVLLTAAIKIERPTWAAGYLVICATLFILLVIIAVFLMLTKFRPHLQEGREYAEWLKDKNMYTSGTIRANKKNSSQELIYKKLERLKSSTVPSNNSELLTKVEDSILYSVSVSDIDGANDIIEAMEELNVDATIYKSPINSSRDISDHEAIWLGKHVPAHIAIPVIKKAVSTWPHLKYIAFPSDSAPEEVMWNIFIGGSTSTAKRNKYKTWSLEEINSLQPMDTADLHGKIRAKYP